jgi:hypothetical protein
VGFASSTTRDERGCSMSSQVIASGSVEITAMLLRNDE